MKLIKLHFESRHAHIEDSPRAIPTFSVPPHEDPHFSCFGETEAGGVCIIFLLSVLKTSC